MSSNCRRFETSFTRLKAFSIRRHAVSVPPSPPSHPSLYLKHILFDITPTEGQVSWVIGILMAGAHEKFYSRRIPLNFNREIFVCVCVGGGNLQAFQTWNLAKIFFVAIGPQDVFS